MGERDKMGPGRVRNWGNIVGEYPTPTAPLRPRNLGALEVYLGEGESDDMTVISGYFLGYPEKYLKLVSYCVL